MSLFLKIFYLACFFFFLSEKIYAVEQNYSPALSQSYPKKVYWGDTHLHTNLSEDAYYYGNTTFGPDKAYRFAKGEMIRTREGLKNSLSRPLDFLVVADHATNMGVMTGLRNSDPNLLSLESGKRAYSKYRNLVLNSIDDVRGISKSLFGTEIIRENIYAKSVWKDVALTADRHNDPGKFTTFIGYEWTSWGDKGGSNLHRVIVFKDGEDRASQIIPFSSVDSARPEDLWRFMEDYENKTGGELLAIPHNGNLSNGRMFDVGDFSAPPINRFNAKIRSRWEPLYEVTQIKGDSETHPIISPTDEFADYERWMSFNDQKSGAKADPKKKQYEYARSALKIGLTQYATLGINPFKFGMIGSTDSHTGMSTADESNFWGKMSDSHPRGDRIFTPVDKKLPYLPRWKTSASGYAAVWAEENTREALFAAMKRKEVYASTGPRIEVRFFGGWDYSKDDALRPDLARVGYSKGVPMGGDLTNAPKGRSPSFIVRAAKDPDGAHLDRVQIIKGWRDDDGILHEKIYNVALSDGRKEGKDGKVPSVGSTVDVKDASYTNSIGSPELAVVWKDPDFNKDELAFYYVRVLEILTPRWTAYDAKFFGIEDIPKEVSMVTQERAYSSPIWYTP